MSPNSPTSFSTTLAITVLIRPLDQPSADWQEFDRGPGFFNLPQGSEACIRIRNINDAILEDLIEEIKGCTAITFLHLSENRNITDAGLVFLKALPQLTQLDLGSCSLSTEGIPYLKALPNLKVLGLSYCNRLTDASLIPLRSIPTLQKLELQGCVKISHGGVARLQRRGLEIHE